MFCGKCGKILEEGCKICPDCSSPNENNTNNHVEYHAENQAENYIDNHAENRPENNPLNYAANYQVNYTGNYPGNYPQNYPVNYAANTLHGIVLTEEEKIVRTYLCSRLRFPSCDGYLTVTNRRVIFHGYGGDSRIVDEVPLDSVSAISTFYGTKIKIGQIITGAAFAIGSLITFAMVNSSSRSGSFFGVNVNNGGTNSIAVLFGFALLISGVVLLAMSIKRAFVLKIYSSSANNSPIDIGSGPGGLVGNSALFSVVAQPTKQTNQMMLELGAMISDLQRLGDHGVEQWKR